MKFLLTLFFIVRVSLCISQSFTCREDSIIRIMFYNVENLFDTEDDSLTNDDEFLPGGIRNWNKHKYYSKLNNVFKAIAAVGEWNPPEIICLAEIENRSVLEDLINKTPIYKYPYQIIHYDSPDKRGIDCAILYNSEKVKITNANPIKISDKNFNIITRDILFAQFKVLNGDTLNVFVNHWPSRWGGKLITEDKRISTAQTLKTVTDSLLKYNYNSKIIITGDFNDGPKEKSIIHTLKTSEIGSNQGNHSLINMSIISTNIVYGTHKFQGNWEIFDQFIISKSLLSSKSKTYSSARDFHIFTADFLLMRDEIHLGIKPKRTYNGYSYLGGYSDHLPIYLDIHLKN